MWKLRGKALSVTSHTPFQKDLIVWKHNFDGFARIIFFPFQKDLIVWKLVFGVPSVLPICVSEGLNSVETFLK